MIDDNSGWPPALALHELFSLVDATCDLRGWADEMERSGVQSLLETRSDWHGRRLPVFASPLANIRNLQRTSRSSESGPTVSPRVVELIRREKRRYFGSEAAEEVQPAPLDNEDCCAKHVLSSTVIFLLQEFGSLDLSLLQVRHALPVYRAAWLNKFTATLMWAERSRLSFQRVRISKCGSAVRTRPACQPTKANRPGAGRADYGAAVRIVTAPAFNAPVPEPDVAVSVVVPGILLDWTIASALPLNAERE